MCLLITFSSSPIAHVSYSKGHKAVFSNIWNRPILFIHSRIQIGFFSVYLQYICLSGHYLWDCTCRGLGPRSRCWCRRRATECSTSTTKPSNSGWRRGWGWSHVSADVKNSRWNFFVMSVLWNLKLNLAVNERIFCYAFRPNLPKKIVNFILCLSLSRVLYYIKKTHSTRNILTFTLDIFMRKTQTQKLNKVQNHFSWSESQGVQCFSYWDAFIIEVWRIQVML